MWGRVVRMRPYPPQEGAVFEVGGMSVLPHFCPLRGDVKPQDPPRAVVTSIEMAIAILICNGDFINKGVLIL